MRERLENGSDVSLEGLCEGALGEDGTAIRVGRGAPGLERLEVRFDGRAFSPHRHDTYALGFTTKGVQAFRYRGESRACRPGEVYVLHPDEMHDGHAGTADGFGYRILYLDPVLVQRALGGRVLPFVKDPVLGTDPRAARLKTPLADMDLPVEEDRAVEIVGSIADILTDLAGAPPPGGGRLDLQAMLRVRSRIAEAPAHPVPMSELEALAALDRWTIARQFRAAFGTSPSRFRTMRQLDETRRHLMRGETLADAALAAGFADQSHMSRAFKRTYGLTPGQWRISTRASAR